jgi:hypothetical protein
LGERITALRRGHGVTQVPLAKAPDVSQQTLRSYEVRRRRIPMLAVAARSVARAQPPAARGSRTVAFGNALGESLKDQMVSGGSSGYDYSDAPDQSEAETARLNRYEANAARSVRTQAYFDQFAEALNGYDGSSIDRSNDVLLADASGVPGEPDSASKQRALERLWKMGMAGGVDPDGQFDASGGGGASQGSGVDGPRSIVKVPGGITIINSDGTLDNVSGRPIGQSDAFSDGIAKTFAEDVLARKTDAPTFEDLTRVDKAHIGLAGINMFAEGPVGFVAGVADAGIYAWEGNWKDAGLSLAGTVPGAVAVSAGQIAKIEGGAAKGSDTLKHGSFSIVDWADYPAGVPKPQGPFRLIDGAEYATVKAEKAAANNAYRQQNGLAGHAVDVHEIQPIKFGGSPTDLANKVVLPRAAHQQQVTPWWNQLMRDISGP